MCINRQKTRQIFNPLTICYYILGTLMLCTMIGCSGFTSVDAKFARTQSATGVHIVSKGETLYSIAWYYGWDYKELASANSITYPYTIYPDQRLFFNRKQYLQNQPVEPAQNDSKVLTSRPESTITETQSAYKSRPAESLATANTGKIKWHWPTRGEVIANFSSKSPVNKGIDIGGRLGEPVMAAAAGTVVYAGSGLLGYGNLVIVKHNDQYLSAYAHNNRLLVKENQQVTAQQPIAEIGSSGTDTVKLHFEIRRNGKPVNPMKYLPKAG